MSEFTDFEIGFLIGCMISIESIGEGNNVEIAKTIKHKLQDVLRNRNKKN